MAKTDLLSIRKLEKTVRGILGPVYDKVKFDRRGKVKQAGFEVAAAGDQIEVFHWPAVAGPNGDSERNDRLALYKRLLEDRLPTERIVMFSGSGYSPMRIFVAPRG